MRTIVECQQQILARMARVLGITVDYLINGEVETNETINQVVLLLRQLSPEFQQVVLEQIKILNKL